MELFDLAPPEKPEEQPAMRTAGCHVLLGTLVCIVDMQGHLPRSMSSTLGF